jgi:hypothetical protein
MASGLPPPPVNDKPGSFSWLEWYRQLRNYVSTSGSVPWYIINFSGSNITDIASRSHQNMQSLQGGTAGEMYHLTADQHNAISNRLEVRDTSTSVSLPSTPTVFKLPSIVDTSGISYDTSTGEITIVNGGTYMFILLLNAKSSTANKFLYFYAELDTGSGYAIRRYSARSQLLKTTNDEQVLFSSTNYFAKGTKIKLYVWGESSGFTIDSQDVPGTTAGTVTLPAARLLMAGSL